MGQLIELFNTRGKQKMKREEKKKPSIFDVANYFLLKLRIDTGSSITPLKLQKLVYYAQAWSLVWDEEELFPEEMQAWAHGPANPELYDKYKRYAWTSIEPPKAETVDVSMFTQEQVETMDLVWDGYGKFDGKFLEMLTHQEAPWIIARGSCKPGERCTTIISKELMKEFYTRMYEEQI